MAETQTLSDNDVPLLERISLGPLEDDAKIFIVERQQTFDVTEEVLSIFHLSLLCLSLSLVNNQNIIDFIKETHFYNLLKCLLSTFYCSSIALILPHILSCY